MGSLTLNTAFVVTMCLVLAFWIKQSSSQDHVDCDINIPNSCTNGSCCVRDEFLYTDTQCKPLGVVGTQCTIRPSQFECPCHPDLVCESNIEGHNPSLFGRCVPANTLHENTTSDPTLVG